MENENATSSPTSSSAASSKLSSSISPVCRLCGKYEFLQISLFSSESSKRQLIAKIQTCLPLQIKWHSSLSNSICYRCVTMVENFYEFYNNTLESVKCLEKQYEIESSSSSIIRDNADIEKPNCIDSQIQCEPIDNCKHDKSTVTDVIKCFVCATPVTCSTRNAIFISNIKSLVDYDDSDSESIDSSNKIFDHKDRFSSVLNEILKRKKRKANNLIEGVNKKQKIESVSLAEIEIKSKVDVNRRKSNKPRRWCEDSRIGNSQELEICLLCSEACENRDELTQHLQDVHGLESREIFDPRMIVNEAPSSQINPAWKHLNFEQISEGLCRERGYFADNNVAIINNLQEATSTEYVCEICARDFNDRASLWLHLRATHPKHASLACGICLKLTNNWEQLAQHTQIMHNPAKLTVSEIRKYFCVICLRQHDSKKKLINHVYVHDFLMEAFKNSGIPFKAEAYVKMNFPSNDDSNIDQLNHESLAKSMSRDISLNDPNDRFLRKNQYNEDEEKSVQEDFDDSITNNYQMFSEGVENNHSQKVPRNYTLNYCCDWCSTVLSTKWDRWLHVANEHAPHNEALRCTFANCQKVFVTEAFRIEHEQHHDMQGEIPNSCEVCCKLWNTRVDFYKHMMGVHPLAVPLVCGVCLKIFQDVKGLHTHVQTTHAPLQGDFVCDICGRAYSNKSKMLRHRRIHGTVDLSDRSELENMSRSNNVKQATSKRKNKSQNLTTPLSIFNNKNLENVMNQSSASSMRSDSEAENLNEPKIEHETYMCKECNDITFDNFDDFSKHKRLVHQVFHCDLCTKYYGRNSHLWKHVNRCHKGNELVTCQFCFKTSASKYHLQQHVNKIHAVKLKSPTKNNLDSRSVSPTSLSVDSFLDRKIDGFNFDSVKQSFLRQELLERSREKGQNVTDDFEDERHMDTEVVNGEMTQPPDEIDVKSELYTSIITNYNPPVSSGAYKCGKCSKSFNKRYLLKKHKKNCRPRLQKDLLTRCKTCERIFKDRQSLQKHLANYHSEFKCHLCALTFPSKCEIITHIRFTHPKHSDFVCEQCGQILRCKADLLAHRLDHRNSHICQFCGDNLTSKMKLKMHVLSLHRKILSLSCGICLKIFATQHILRDHVRLVHFQDMRHENSCSVCGKKYGSKWKCFDHINKSHGKIFKPCKLCLAVFESDQQIRDHFTKMHVGFDKSFETTFTPIKPPMEASTKPSIPKITLTSNKNDSGPSYSIKTHQQQQLEQRDNKFQIPPKRTVYEDSDAPSMCEICLKTWPAKKHLWQHYIRCHKQAAATVCGICLKLSNSYSELSIHLHEKHPTLLHGKGFGSNFICKICGRYHNASSKLKLHMAIHVNYNKFVEIKTENFLDMETTKEESPCNSSTSSSSSSSSSGSDSTSSSSTSSSDSSTSSHSKSTNSSVNPFRGFDSSEIKESVHHFRRISNVMRSYPDLDEIPSDNDCDSEDERQKLLLKMSPLSAHGDASNIEDDVDDADEEEIVPKIENDYIDSEDDEEDDEVEPSSPPNFNAEWEEINSVNSASENEYDEDEDDMEDVEEVEDDNDDDEEYEEAEEQPDMSIDDVSYVDVLESETLERKMLKNMLVENDISQVEFKELNNA